MEVGILCHIKKFHVNNSNINTEQFSITTTANNNNNTNLTTVAADINIFLLHYCSY